MRLTHWLGLLLVGYWIMIATATHIPMERFPHSPTYADKVVHFLGYLLLAVLMAAWWTRRRRLTWSVALTIWAVTCLYAVIDELLQIPVNRSCDIRDWLADVSGSATGLALLAGYRRLRPAGHNGAKSPSVASAAPPTP